MPPVSPTALLWCHDAPMANFTRAADVESLRAFPVFASLDDETLAFVAGRTSEFVLTGGECLFRQGDASDCVFLLLSGRCRAYRDGRPVGAIHSGEPVGEVGYFSKMPRSATIIAERDCWLLRFGIDDLEALLTRHPPFASAIAQALALRLGDSSEHRAKGRNRSTAFIFGDDVDAGMQAQVLALLEQACRRHGTAQSLGSRADVRAATGASDMQGERAHAMLLSDLERRNDHLIYHARFNSGPNWINTCLHQADRCFIVHRHAGAPQPGETEARLARTRHGRHTGLVLLHEKRPPTPQNTARWRQGRDVAQLLHAGLDQPGDWRRLARIMFDRAIGLVLCGGGALYSMHVGAIKAMVEMGFAFDCVGGSSAGGCAGLAYAFGITAEEFGERARQLFEDRRAMRRYTAPVFGLVNPATFDDGLRRASEGRDVEDLPVPYFTTAINLSRNRYEIIDRGPVWEAMRATASIPGLLPPFVRGGDLLADGAGYDSLPVFAMREKIAGHVIAVNFAEPEDPQGSHDYARRPHWLRWLFGARRTGPPHFPLLKDSLVQAFRFSGNSRLPESMLACDLLLTPQPPPGAGFLNWNMHRPLLEAGYAHAMERVAALEAAGDEGLRKIRAALV